MSATINRRELWQARHVGQAAGIVWDAAPEPEGIAELSNGCTSLLSVSRRAMACLFEVLLPADTPKAVDAGQAALDEIDRLESQLTVYRNSSEVDRLNSLAAYAPVPVEDRLFGLLTLCARLHAETDGAFDITAGALIKCWGFFRGPRRIPPAIELEAARERVGMQHVALDPLNHSIHYARLGLEINLGSIGKGYALDQVAGLLRKDFRVTAGLLHGGYSSVYALGSPAAEPCGWSVGICDPRDPSLRVACVRIKDRALGTSAATFQHLIHEGRKLGHILDPRTGWPTEGMLCASVAAPTAAEADALATAFFILGVDKARAYCEQHPEVGALLIPEAELDGSLRIITVGNIAAEVLSQPQSLEQNAPVE